MPTPTYTPLANITLASNQSSVTFSSISGSYRDLVLVATGYTSGADSLNIAFNGDTVNTSYNGVFMTGTGSSTSSGVYANSRYIINNYGLWDATNIAGFTLNIMDYSATDKHKTFLSRANSASYGTDAFVSRWSSTAAITTIALTKSSAGTINAGSTFALFGIVS